MLLTPINRQKLSSQIFIQLQQYLSEANLNSGDRLPSERELAASLNVSRNSLREAFRVLEILGLIEIIPGSGTYIKKVNNDTIIPLAMALSIENNSIREIMEVRVVFECSGAKLAAQKRTPEDLLHIQKTLEEMKTSIGDVKTWLKADMRFHYLVVKASSNSLLLRLYYTIADSLSKAMGVVANTRFKSEQGALDTLEEHIAIYNHIKDQNSEMAEKAMLKHLLGVLNEITANEDNQ